MKWWTRLSPTLRSILSRLRLKLDEPLMLGTLAAIVGIVLTDTGFYHLVSAIAAIGFGLGFFLQTRSRSFFLLVVAAVFAIAHDQRQQRIHALPLATEIASGKTLLVEAEGVIDSSPKVSVERPGKTRFFLKLKNIREIGGSTIPCSNRIYVSATADPPPMYGDRIKLEGKLRAPSNPRNPGEFDFGKFLERKAVVAQLNCDPQPGLQLVASNEGNPLITAANHARRWVASTITHDLRNRDDDVAGVLTAMTLGTRDDTRDEIIDSFRTSGTLHIFAVSGLHVGLIGVILWLLIAPLPIDRRLRALIVIVTLCSYAFVTGLRPSAVRATIMACLVLAGPMIDREPRVINSLGAAGFLILAFDSNQLFLPGFQLSFMVLLALTLLHKPILEVMLPFVSHDPFLPHSLLTNKQRTFFKGTRSIAETFAVSLAAWLGSLPLMLYHFHLVTPIAPFANILLIPVAFAILGTAILSTIAGGIGLTTLCAIFNNSNFLFASILIAIAGFFARLPPPISHFYTALPPAALRPACEITSIDLSRGGASTLISTRSGHDWLVDTGSSRDFKPTLSAVLHEHSGITHIDGMILTHADAAHIGGAIDVLDLFQPDEIFLPPPNRSSSTYRNLVTRLSYETNGLNSTKKNQIIRIDQDTRIEILYTPDPSAKLRLSDDACIVFVLESHGWRILFTGDAGFTTEQRLLETSRDQLRADIIIRGHHNSDHSLTPEFLEAIDPQLIIATARDFENSSPDAKIWQETAASRSIRLLDQEKHGAVTVKVSPNQLEISSFLTKEKMILDQPRTVNRAR